LGLPYFALQLSPSQSATRLPSVRFAPTIRKETVALSLPESSARTTILYVFPPPITSASLVARHTPSVFPISASTHLFDDFRVPACRSGSDASPAEPRTALYFREQRALRPREYPGDDVPGGPLPAAGLASSTRALYKVRRGSYRPVTSKSRRLSRSARKPLRASLVAVDCPCSRLSYVSEGGSDFESSSTVKLAGPAGKGAVSLRGRCI
jgi:hypothetical protein